MNRLMQLRYDKGLSVERLAAMAGVSAGTIYALESGRTARPRVETVRPLAAVLGVPASELLAAHTADLEAA